MSNAGDSGAGSGTAPDSRRWLGLVGLLLSTFMGILDAFIVYVAAPSIQSDLTAGFSDIQLVLSGYVLAYAVGLVCGGRLGDRYGRRRVFLIGVVAFVAASVGCAAAPSVTVLISVRVVQGLAAALMLPQVLSVVQVAFPDDERPRALTFYGATIGIASVAGQLVGGALIAADVAGLGWRAVFLVNVPLGAVAAALVAGAVSESRASENSALDLRGVLLLAVLLCCLLYPLTAGAGAGWPWWSYAVLVATVPALFAFAWWEHALAARGGRPLLPTRLLRERGFALGMPVVVVFYSGNAGLFLLLAYFLQEGLGLDALDSGLVFLPLGIGFAVASLASRPLVDRMGPMLLTLGALAMTAGLAGARIVTAPHPADVQSWLLAPALFVTGSGEGLVAAPLIGAVLDKVNPDDAGAASGALLTATQVANALGVAVIGTVLAGILGAHPGADGLSASDYRAGFADTVYVLIGLGILTTVLLAVSVGRRATPDSQPEDAP